MMRKLLGRLIKWASDPVPVVPKVKRSLRRNIAASITSPAAPVGFVVQLPTLMPGVIPEAEKSSPARMAMDSAAASLCQYANTVAYGSGFPGYPFLAELTQQSEYRSPSETMAQEMTRNWIRLRAAGEGDLHEKLERIEAELVRHKVQDIMRLVIQQDGFFGRSQIYIRIKGVTDQSRKQPLVIDKATVQKGSLLGFKVIEPIWTTPSMYNSNDPSAPDFFKPTAWFVMGKETHASRLLTIVSREVPDMLKPAYNFGGISLSQLMIPTVRAWIKTRDNVNDIISWFNTSGIKTDMSDIMTGGDAQALLDRADIFNANRANRGLLMLDSDPASPEEFFQYAVPLANLDHLQAQAQEHMAAPCHIPLIKLFGISPSGLNATAEPELDVFGDHTHALQEAVMTTPLTQIIQLIQLDVWGEIDPAITFEYEPLKQLDGADLAAIRKSDADAAVGLIAAGVISPEEERQRLASDVNSGYDSLVAEDVPELPGSGDEGPEGDLDA